MKNRIIRFISKRKSNKQRREYIRTHDIFSEHNKAYQRQFNLLAGRCMWY